MNRHRRLRREHPEKRAMPKLLFHALCALLMSGCATEHPQRGELGGWQGKTVALAAPDAGLIAGTPGKLIASGATNGWWDGGMAATGAQLAAQNQLQDSNAWVGEQLIRAAQERFGVLAAAPLAVRSGALDTPTQLAHAAAGADLVVNVTGGTTFVSRLLAPGHYEVITFMSARIIEVPSGRTLADAACRQTPAGAGYPTYDELFAEHAARLRAIMRQESNACPQHFKSELLHIGVG